MILRWCVNGSVGVHRHRQPFVGSSCVVSVKARSQFCVYILGGCRAWRGDVKQLAVLGLHSRSASPGAPSKLH